MQQQVLPYQFENHVLRVEMDADGTPWFIAMDVAAILDYSDAYEMTKRLDDDEKQNRQIAGFGPRGVNVINESGLYSAILGSQKPEAKRFKRWVTAEVLPSIRKTGGYRMRGAKPASVAQQLAAHPVRLRLMDKLERETHPEKRAGIIAQLVHASQVIGIPAPDVDKIGRAVVAPPVPPLVGEFWAVLGLLGGLDEFNHTARTDTLAINLPEIADRAAKEGLPLPPLNELRQALKASEQPQYVGLKVIHSVRNRRRKSGTKSVKCMVFAMRPSPQAKAR